MNRRNFTACLSVAGMAATTRTTLAAKAKKPNLLIIHTDEHNFRTIGCCRELLSEDQAFVWGKGVKVDTPNLDRIAHEGAQCAAFYAASPVCTPSRASFVTGLYPIATRAYRNDIPMYDDLPTFASVLKEQGYATSYVGKWHLDGKAKPGFHPPRNFGFSDNRFMMNRGHWKGLAMEDGVPEVIGLIPEKETQKFNVAKSTPENFTTDFLTSRTLEILERDKGRPFCHMLSIPDPHGPNSVRPPYDTMFRELHFEHPRTMDVTEESLPAWAKAGGNKQQAVELDQTQMQHYFGMVKCVDDNVGRILQWLEDNGLVDNTIVVFTSDHGDLMGEHKRHNKGQPYETSARVAFLIRYPRAIPAGKVVRTPYTTVDFSATMLGLMGEPGLPGTQGVDGSRDFTSKQQEVYTRRVAFVTSSYSNWLMTTDGRHKLVVCEDDVPWLFDLKKDPDEVVNQFTNPEYAEVAKKLAEELQQQAERYDDPGLKTKKYKWGV